jgi:hypothetical protein
MERTRTQVFFLLIACSGGLIRGAELCDILYDAKTPIDAGHGIERNGNIQWRSIDGSRKTYSKPPHWMASQVKKCDGLKISAIGPEPFGLVCEESGNCRVANSEIAIHFFPKSKNGDTVEFSETRDHVKIRIKAQFTWQVSEEVAIDKKSWVPGQSRL